MSGYGRRFRGRYNRHYRRNLSNRAIFSKTKAKNQAYQIASLRNRLNKVYKLTRKEIKNTQEVFNKTFTNSALSDTYSTWSLTDDFMVGQWTKMRGLSIKGVLEYGDNKEEYPGVSQTRSGSIRIIVYQSLQSRTASVGVDAVADIHSTGTDYELNTTRPLKTGVSSYVKILADKVYTLSDQQPQKRVNINIRKMLNLHKEMEDTTARGRVFIGIISSGLHWVSGGYTENITASLVAKQVYTED